MLPFPSVMTFAVPFKRLGQLSAVLLLGTALVSCAPSEKVIEEPDDTARVVLQPSGFEQLPGWQDDTLAEALPALRLSCERLQRQNPSKALGPEGLAGTVADWKAPCLALSRLSDGDTMALRALLRDQFRVFSVTDRGEADGFFTGYYEIELKGSLLRQEGYTTPLYAPPEELVTVALKDFRTDLPAERLVGRVDKGRLRPYYDRKEIDDGVLVDRGLEIAWLADPVDAFFLHIQGSGRLVLPDGSTQRVGYAGNNGHRFFPIGRAMLDEGLIKPGQASMQSIRDWLRANPTEAQVMMQRNKRFIFFRTINGPGPIGTQGVPLTAGRSLAVDPRHLPLGVPLWLSTTWPSSGKPLNRLMVAQDTGSAIRGVVRGDFFWGTGEEALKEAGRMKQKGRYWLLLPVSVAQQRMLISKASSAEEEQSSDFSLSGLFD